jgi:transcriptional regulator with GAF, ATPase, and Fis domain
MQNYKALFEIGKALTAETDINKLLPMAMDRVISETKAQRGMITVRGGDGELLFETARKLNKEDIKKPEFEISKTLINSVLDSGKPVVLQNALETPEFAGSASIGRLRVLSVACSPLCLRDGSVFGVIYIDNRDLASVFDEDTGKLLQDFSELISVAIKNAIDHRRLLEKQQKLQTALDEKMGYGEIIGGSPAMQAVFKLIDKVADKDVTVLITGETGTGKELVAREIQRRSPRSGHEFVAFSCANLPEQLLESELFGHEKGAFTGADRRKRGMFEQADNGTVFLDEIGEMSPSVQAKMLRFLQSGEFKPLGGETIKKTDIRLIAATNRDLVKMISDRLFREDLYYRLNVIEIKLPPLRGRGEDVVRIGDYFLQRYSQQFNTTAREFDPAAREKLLHYDYPGNVRELENIIQRTVILAEGASIRAADLAFPGASAGKAPAILASTNFNDTKKNLIDSFERDYISKMLQETKGNISEAARRAGMHKKNFIQKMQQYGISREEFI